MVLVSGFPEYDCFDYASYAPNDVFRDVHREFPHTGASKLLHNPMFLLEWFDITEMPVHEYIRYHFPCKPRLAQQLKVEKS